jgi:DNA modification methylase
MPVLTFKGKTAVENYHHTIPHHVLKLDAGRSVLAKGEKPSLDGNLIIEGDNLLALKALLPTHAGRIKCIYIDPPYNTGNEGWVYNDNLTQPQFKEWIGQVVGKEGEDACRHDKWCCMMYPRLLLLRELLHEDGVIFVSIDDIEISNLRLLMAEVFGQECFIACLVWKARQYPDARAKTGVSVDHEYILVWGKRPGNRLRGGERDESKYSNPDNDPRGPWMSRSILGLAPQEKRPNLHYDLVDPKTKWCFKPPKETGWRYEPATTKRKILEERILFPPTRDGRPREKVFLHELKTKFPGLPSIMMEPFTADGTKEIRELFGTGVFQFPKPAGLIRCLVEQVTEEDDLVLDSFAGSGTTGHAVLLQNKADDSARRFILVQQRHDTKEQFTSSSNVCEELTAERVRRAIRGYEYGGEQTETLLEAKLSLSVLKKADNLLGQVETAKAEAEGKFNEIRVSCVDGVVRVVGIRQVSAKAMGLGGSFTYARLGPPLLGEHKTWGEKPPAFGDLAQYIFFTETSRQLDAQAVNEATGRLGEHAGTSYYLLYTPDPKQSRALDRNTMGVLAKDKARRKVVYCEKLWLHREELAAAREQGNDVRPMLLPFQVK